MGDSPRGILSFRPGVLSTAGPTGPHLWHIPSSRSLTRPCRDCQLVALFGRAFICRLPNFGITSQQQFGGPHDPGMDLVYQGTPKKMPFKLAKDVVGDG